MGGTAPAVQQAGLAEEEGAGADAQDAGAALDGGTQLLGEVVGLAYAQVVGRDTDEVRRGKPLRAVRGPNLETVRWRRRIW
ncbi:hypothetical protein ACM563_35240 [Streptomyces xantholiticus]